MLLSVDIAIFFFLLFLTLIIGLKTNKRMVFIGISVGFSVFVFCELSSVQKIANAGSLVSAMMANFVTLVFGHYVFSEKGFFDISKQEISSDVVVSDYSCKPLAKIETNVNLLYNKYDNLFKSKHKQLIAEMSNSLRDLKQLVKNSSDLAKLSQSKIELNKQFVNLSDLVYESLTRCKELYISDKNQNDRIWNIDIMDNVIANCDKYYLSNVLDNLIINAIQYCKKGTITLRLYQEKTHFVKFEIVDEGIGVPEGELNEIFEPFVIGSLNPEESSERGIGLTLARRVMVHHSGGIDAYNNKYMKGATFYFIFPINN